MHQYVELAHSMLKDNFTGLVPKEGDVFDGDGFGPARAHEMQYAFHIPLFPLLADFLLISPTCSDVQYKCYRL
jgi:hypothetical protein